MKKDDTKQLLETSDRPIAEEVQRFLDDNGIYTMLVSDNPASSVMNTYMGAPPSEKITMMINHADYQAAVRILSSSRYMSLLPGQ